MFLLLLGDFIIIIKSCCCVLIVRFCRRWRYLWVSNSSCFKYYFIYLYL